MRENAHHHLMGGMLRAGPYRHGFHANLLTVYLGQAPLLRLPAMSTIAHTDVPWLFWSCDP